MPKTPDDAKRRQAEARRAGIRIVVRDGVRVDDETPASRPAGDAPAAPTAPPEAERRERNPRRDAITEAIRRANERGSTERTSRATTDEELRQRQREHLERVHAGRSGGRTREIDCAHNQCTSCWGTRVKANGEPCIHMIVCGCGRCSRLQPRLLATNSAC